MLHILCFEVMRHCVPSDLHPLLIAFCGHVSKVRIRPLLPFTSVRCPSHLAAALLCIRTANLLDQVELVPGTAEDCAAFDVEDLQPSDHKVGLLYRRGYGPSILSEFCRGQTSELRAFRDFANTQAAGRILVALPKRCQCREADVPSIS